MIDIFQINYFFANENRTNFCLTFYFIRERLIVQKQPLKGYWGSTKELLT